MVFFFGQCAIGAASGRALHDAPEHRRSRSDPRRRYAQRPSLRGRDGRPDSEATTCEWLYCDFDTRTSSWRFSDPLRSGASSMARPAATAVSTGNGVAASTPTSIPFVLALSGLRALRIDVGAPPTAQEQSSAAPLVRRGQETVIGTFARGLTGRSTSTPG